MNTVTNLSPIRYTINLMLRPPLVSFWKVCEILLPSSYITMGRFVPNPDNMTGLILNATGKREHSWGDYHIIPAVFMPVLFLKHGMLHRYYTLSRVNIVHRNEANKSNCSFHNSACLEVCSLEVCEFELQFRYYILFRTYIFGKGKEGKRAWG